MRNTVTERVTLNRGKIPVPLKVRGVWLDNHLAFVTVEHGHEYLHGACYAPLIAEATQLAEIKHRKYLEDQIETKRSIISRLCGTF